MKKPQNDFFAGFFLLLYVGLCLGFLVVFRLPKLKLGSVWRNSKLAEQELLIHTKPQISSSLNGGGRKRKQRFRCAVVLCRLLAIFHQTSPFFEWIEKSSLMIFDAICKMRLCRLISDWTCPRRLSVYLARLQRANGRLFRHRESRPKKASAVSLYIHSKVIQWKPNLINPPAVDRIRSAKRTTTTRRSSTTRRSTCRSTCARSRARSTIRRRPRRPRCRPPTHPRPRRPFCKCRLPSPCPPIWPITWTWPGPRTKTPNTTRWPRCSWGRNNVRWCPNPDWPPRRPGPCPSLSRWPISRLSTRPRSVRWAAAGAENTSD